MTVLSIQKHTITITAPAVEGTAALTGITDITMCVPFVTTRVSAPATTIDEFAAYQVRADFNAGAVRLRTETGSGLGSREIVCEVTVVEFDPTYVNVYQGTSSFADNQASITVASPFASPVVLSKAWLYCTATATTPTDAWYHHLVRGDITGTNELTFSSNVNTTRDVHWYVVECKNTEWEVFPRDITIPVADLSASITDLPTVDTAKTFVIGSYYLAGDPFLGGTNEDSNRQFTIDVELQNGTTLAATRREASVNLSIEWSGFVVEFASGGNENVYRNTLTTSATSPDTQAIGATVTAANCLVHPSGHQGTMGGGSHNDNDNSHDVIHGFCAWTLTDTTVSCAHDTANSFEAGSVTWEVIEWDVGGAPPVTPRRVMVIS